MSSQQIPPLEGRNAEILQVAIQNATAIFIAELPTHPVLPDGSRYSGPWRKLGEGGMGEVWKAFDKTLSREVAIKIPKVGLDGSLTPKALLQEANIHAKLEHRAIVPIQDVGVLADGRSFFAMRFIKGVTLAKLLEDRPRPHSHSDEPRFLEYFEEICRAVAEAHSKTPPILHRDLKPLNVMVANSVEVFVLDWGIARLLDAKDIGSGWPTSTVAETIAVAHDQTPVRGRVLPTGTGHVKGSPGFMSPEQARGENSALGPTADVFALGGLLCMILCGQQPYPADAKIEEIEKHLKETFENLNTCGADDELVKLAQKCLQFKSADRPPNAMAVLAAFEEARRAIQARLRKADDDRKAAEVREAEERKRRKVLRALVNLSVLSLIVVTGLGLYAGGQWLRAEGHLKTSNAERIAADHARDETNSVLDYFVSAFRKPDPSADGEKVTVAELLDRAANELDAKFPKQPLIQAKLLDAIGKTYRGLGLYHKAVAVQVRAWDLSRDALGDDHEYTRTMMNNLAAAYISADRPNDAVPLLEQVLKVRKNTLGRKHRDTLRSMNNLAAAFEAANRVEEALPLWEETVELRKAEFGVDDPETLTSMANLAVAYGSTGRRAKGLALLEETLRAMKVKPGAMHPDTLAVMSHLASAYEDDGKLEKALLLYEETLKQMKVTLGATHPDTLRLMSNLAFTYKSAGRLGDALSLYEETMTLMKAKSDPEDADALTLMNNLARAYLTDEQPEKALPLFDQWFGIQRARALPDDPTFADKLAAVSVALLQHHQYSAAETYLRECLIIREKSQPTDWTTFNTKSMLGGSLLGQNNLAGAEPHLLSGYQGMKEREARIPAGGKIRVSESIRRIIDLYTAMEKPDEVAKWRKTLMDLKLTGGTDGN